MNNQLSEHETYILPGTNVIIKDEYAQRIVEAFQVTHNGMFTCRNHYITVSGRLVHVHDATFFVKTKTGFRQVFEPGFDYVGRF